jgi:hypothetical protein
MTGFTPAFFFQALYAVFIIGFFDIIKMLAGYTVNSTGLRYILELFGKFEYTQFSFDKFFLGGHFILFFGLIGVNPGNI